MARSRSPLLRAAMAAATAAVNDGFLSPLHLKYVVSLEREESRSPLCPDDASRVEEPPSLGEGSEC